MNAYVFFQSPLAKFFLKQGYFFNITSTQIEPFPNSFEKDRESQANVKKQIRMLCLPLFKKSTFEYSLFYFFCAL